MKFFFVFGKSLPLFPEWLRAQSFFQCRAQSFFLCTEPFSCAQSFFLCTEPFPVHRAFCRAQSFPLCTELFTVHRAFCRAQSFVLAAFATLVCQRNCVFLCKGTKLKIVMPVFAFASGNSYFINSLVQKLQNSAQAEFWG